MHKVRGTVLKNAEPRRRYAMAFGVRSLTKGCDRIFVLITTMSEIIKTHMFARRALSTTSFWNLPVTSCYGMFMFFTVVIFPALTEM